MICIHKKGFSLLVSVSRFILYFSFFIFIPNSQTYYNSHFRKVYLAPWRANSFWVRVWYSYSFSCSILFTLFFPHSYFSSFWPWSRFTCSFTLFYSSSIFTSKSCLNLLIFTCSFIRSFLWVKRWNSWVSYLAFSNYFI